ncbi:MAG TPA: hypothetical protein VFW96_26315 [Thermomicrobiales bacterium]|nr:hypothetical protein [Thermomicrobiales bacterium]
MMTTTSQQPRGAHLVGSVPLADAEAVFRTASGILGGHLRRIPDGETGVRTNWIGWQARVMADNPALEPEPSADAYSALRRFRLRAGADPAALAFGPLGYAAAAQASYATFARLKGNGTIPARCRFMVSLPTPLAPVSAFVALEAQAAVEPPYERRLLAELDEIGVAIPHDQLAVQWDVAVEFALLEGMRPAPFADVRGRIVARLIRLGGRVPRDVELGYHLCYGDAGHQHFKQPEDTAKLVDVANAVSAGVDRPIQWIHLPVPRGRDDDAYFAPLRDLRLHPETERYLGLVHYTDGAEGTRRRVAAARRTLTDFGVATECGMGRRPAETIPALLRIHAEVAAPVA